MRRLFIIPVLAGSLLLGACTETKMSENDVEVIFEILKKNPDRLVQAMEYAQEYQEQQNIKKSWVKAEHKNISYDGIPVIGTGENKVTFYYSYTCGYCREVQEIGRKLVMDNNTQAAFKIISDSEISKLAYSIFVELFNNDKDLGLAFNDVIFAHQIEFFKDPEKVIKIALEKLGQPESLIQSVKGKYDEHIRINAAEFSEFDFPGTPSAVVNDKYPVIGLQNLALYREAMNLK